MFMVKCVAKVHKTLRITMNIYEKPEKLGLGKNLGKSGKTRIAGQPVSHTDTENKYTGP